MGFLGRGQEYYFYQLHRFSSREGERVFGPGKLVNGPLVANTTAALLARFAGEPPATGAAVLAAFSELTGADVNNPGEPEVTAAEVESPAAVAALQ